MDEISKTMNRVTSLGEFFGASLQDVSHFNIMIALHSGCPDWLAGVTNEYDLPRRQRVTQLAYAYVVPPSEEGRAKLATWIVEVCRGSWAINNRWVSFDDDVDAVQYRLTF